MFKGLSYIAGLVMMVGCTEGTVYHTYRDIGGGGWHREDTLVFPIPGSPTDEEMTCSLYVGMRITSRYPYADVSIETEEIWDSLVVRLDTVVVSFLGDNGDIGGRGIRVLQFEQPVRAITLRPSSKGELRIRHVMRRESLPHISDCGIRIQGPPTKQ